MVSSIKHLPPPGWVPPWDPNYTSSSNPVPAGVALPWKESAVTASVPTPTPTVSVIPPTVPISNADFAQQIEAEINNLANQALAEAQRAVLSSLQKPADPVLNPNDLTKPAARSRALRALVIGLLIAMAYGVLATIGTAGNIDFFSKTGLVSFGTLVAGAAINAGISYVARLKIEPKAD